MSFRLLFSIFLSFGLVFPELLFSQQRGQRPGRSSRSGGSQISRPQPSRDSSFQQRQNSGRQGSQRIERSAPPRQQGQTSQRVERKRETPSSPGRSFPSESKDRGYSERGKTPSSQPNRSWEKPSRDRQTPSSPSRNSGRDYSERKKSPSQIPNTRDRNRENPWREKERGNSWDSNRDRNSNDFKSNSRDWRSTQQDKVARGSRFDKGGKNRVEPSFGRKSPSFRSFTRSRHFQGRMIDRHYFSRSFGHHRFDQHYPRYWDYSPRVCRSFHRPGYWSWKPFYYRWTWVYSPWWDWHGYYFHPYVYYTTPAYWLTDFVLVTLMYEPYYSTYSNGSYDYGWKKGYEEGYRDARISESTKAQIRKQIEEEIDENRPEREELPSSLMDKMRDPDYLFVVSEGFSTYFRGSSKTCSLSEGDLLKVARIPNEDDDSVLMRVETSKRDSCPPGSEVDVSFIYLQNFKNNFSEAIESGLQKLEEENISD